ncbi:MAG: glycosyltransferase family 4 protein [Candidatus Bathyarchaeia archaeon]
MKIAVFVEYLPPKMGSDRRIFELMKRLSKLYEIHFIVLPPIRFLMGAVKDYVRRPHRHGENPKVYEGIAGHYTLIPSFLANLWQSSILLAYFLTVPLLLLKAIKILAGLKPEVIVVNYPSPYTGLVGFTAAKLFRKPVMVDFSDLIAQYTANILNLKRGCFKARMLIHMQSQIVKNSEFIVAPTNFIKNYALAQGVSDKKVRLIPNGVDAELFNSEKYDGESEKKKLGLCRERTCLYFGRLDAWAGVNMISKLCRAASERKMDLKFVLVGSGEQQKIIWKGNVIHLGEHPYEKMPEIIAAADCILVPFPQNEVSHGASPLKLFEGMAMEKPVIASRVSGIEEVISDGENGYLADPQNVEDWILKIEKVFKSRNKAIDVGKKARKTVEKNFNWSFLAKQFEEALTKLVLKN